MDIYNNVIDCSGVYIKVIATKLAAQSIEFKVGGGKMPRILNTRIKLMSGKPFHIPNSNVTPRQPGSSLCILAVHEFTFFLVPSFSLRSRA
jgi:hypothetical protein